MMKTFFSAGFWILFSSACFAAEPVCYERVYDAAHMKKHGLQEITKMRLDLVEGDAGQIRASFRELPDYISSNVICDANTTTNRCEIEGKGGTFSVVKISKGIKLTNTSQIRFGGADDGITIGREAEHRVFLLFPVDCRT